MASAEGQVQEMRYTATFPLLLNISNEPTYFMALKDASNLVKMYAMVNVRQYQIVVAADTVEKCEQMYVAKLAESGIVDENEVTTVSYIVGKIATIRSAVKGGNTCYYFQLEDGKNEGAITPQVYSLSVETDERAAILNIGDTVTFVCGEVAEDAMIIPVSQLKLQ